MKRHNLFKVVMLTVLIATVLTFILPIVSFNDTYGLVADGTKQEVGVFTLMNYVGEAIHYFGYVGIYVLIVGGLYGVLNKIPAYKKVVDKLVKSFKKKEWLLIAILMLFIAGVAAFANMSIAIIVLFPFVIAVVLAMGYDRITAALATCGSVCAGLMGSALSLNNTYGFDYVIGTTAREGLKFKGLIFVLVVAAMIVYTVLYAKKHRTEKDVNNELFVPQATSKSKVKVWPLVVGFDLILILLIIGFISWKDPLNINIFTQFHETVNNFSVGGYPIFKNILGLSNALGTWTLVEASVTVMLGAWLISFIYRVKFNDFLTSFMDGCEKALKAAILVVLIYVVLVIIVYVPYVLGILKPIIELTDTLNVFTMSFTAFIASIFGVESYYASLGTGALPYAMTVYQDLAAGDLRLMAVIWQSMYGLAMLVAPTSVVLMATLSYLNVPYHKWLKGVWKVFLVILVLLLAVFLLRTII